MSGIGGIYECEVLLYLFGCYAGGGGNVSVTLDDCAFDSELIHQSSAAAGLSAANVRKTAQRHVPRKTNSGS